MKVEAALAEPPIKRAKPEALIQSDRPRLLLAEDNRTISKLIAKILDSVGLTIHHVVEGDLAFEALMKDDFVLALIDIDLPKMTGLDVTKLYRFSAIGRKRVPILGLVADMSTQEIGACIDAGMDGCLTKPIDPTHLLEAVKAFTSGEAAADLAPKGRTAFLEAPFTFAGAAHDEAPHETPAVNVQVLRDLEQLGGRRFVEGVVSQFMADAGRIFPELATAVKNTDVQSSRDLLHALRSCAANVGASAIFELCLAWREIDHDELVARGEAYLVRLNAAFDDACLSMRDYSAAELSGAA